LKEKVANTFGILGLAELLQICASKPEAKKLINALSV